MTSIAAHLRGQMPFSTDPSRLEEEACKVEGVAPTFGGLFFVASDGRRRARALLLPNTDDCLRAMFEAYARLRELGWADAIYCPKDGTVFDSISAGSTGIHDCFYQGEWPTGAWWTLDGGDLWPGSPILFRLKRQ